MRSVGLAFALIAAAGCFAPVYENGRLRCREGDCPQGYYCAADKRCWKQGTAPGGGEDAQPNEDSGNPQVPDAGPVVTDASEPEVPPPIDTNVDPNGPDADLSARLTALQLTPGILSPGFATGTFVYEMALTLFTRVVSVRATAENPRAVLTLNGQSATGSLATMMALPPTVWRTDLGVTLPTGGTARYALFFNPGSLLTYVKPPNTHTGMAFGRSTAASGNTFVVGAPDDKSLGEGPQTGELTMGTADVGAVFVHTYDSRWQREVVLKAMRVHPQMKFGAAVAIAGDTVVVGAPWENGGAREVNGPADQRAPKSGAAYVFVRTDDGWIEQAYLKAPSSTAGDNFGASVAIASHTNPAGMAATTVAIGAPNAAGPNGQARTGAVHVFARVGPAGAWTLQASPNAREPRGNSEFGASVALSGDTLVVGAPSEDSGGSGVGTAAPGSSGDSGSAFLFVRNGAVWGPALMIKSPTGAQDANFGARVAVAGTHMAISAPGDAGGTRGIDQTNPSPPSPGSGAVHLYVRNDNGWRHLHAIKASNARPMDLFGRGLSLSASTLVIGAPLEDFNAAGVTDPLPDSGSLDSGAAYVYRPIDGRWTELFRLKAPNIGRGDQFGGAVATDGDTVVVGAEAEASGERNLDGNRADESAPGSGAVYVY